MLCELSMIFFAFIFAFLWGWDCLVLDWCVLTLVLLYLKVQYWSDFLPLRPCKVQQSDSNEYLLKADLNSNDCGSDKSMFKRPSP